MEIDGKGAIGWGKWMGKTKGKWKEMRLYGKRKGIKSEMK